jgi:hypothetical protein
MAEGLSWDEAGATAPQKELSWDEAGAPRQPASLSWDEAGPAPSATPDQSWHTLPKAKEDEQTGTPEPETPGVLTALSMVPMSAARNLASAAMQGSDVVRGNKPRAARDLSQAETALSQPIDYLAVPSGAGIAKAVYQLGTGLVESAPEIGGAVVGGLGGAALGAPTGPGAAITGAIGAVTGATLANGIRSFAPLYREELDRLGPGKEDEAFNSALKRTAISAGVTAASFAAFEAAPFAKMLRGAFIGGKPVEQAALEAGFKPDASGALRPRAQPVGQMLAQQTPAQTAIAAAGHAAQNWQQDKPLGEHMDQAIGAAILGTAVPPAAHAIASRVARPGIAPELAAANRQIVGDAGIVQDPGATPAPPAPPQLSPGETALANVQAGRPATEGVTQPRPVAQSEPPRPPEAAPPVAAAPEPPPPPASPAPRQPGAIESLDPNQIGVDAQRFQFKSGGDERGVTERLQGVTEWNPLLAGAAIVWRDAEGRDWVADGHQRVGLAQRLAGEGQEGIRINAHVLRAEDGISDVSARFIAAAKNVAEGTGSAIDAAKMFRDAEATGLTLPEMPPKSALVRDGRAMANLAPEAWGMVVNEIVPTNQAAAVGRLVSDPLQQVEAMRLLATAKPDNARQAEMMVRDMLATGTERQTQDSLFGAEAFASSVVLERAKIVDDTMKLIQRDRAVFRLLVRDAEKIESTGKNALDAEANSNRLSTDEQVANTLAGLATRHGPVSDALSAIARQLKGGEISRVDAGRQFLDVVRRGAEGRDTEGNQPRAAGRGDEGAGQEGPVEGQGGFFSRREKDERFPLLSDKAGLERVGQTVLPGAEKRVAPPTISSPSRTVQRTVSDLPLFASDKATGQGKLFSTRDHVAAEAHANAAPDAAVAPPEAQQARVRLYDTMQAVMRFLGLPHDVGLRLVDKLLDDQGRGADGMYASRLMTLALDTPPGELPGKLFHESLHAIRELNDDLKLLTPKQMKALDNGARLWLQQRPGKETNRERLTRLGYSEAEMLDEAVARMGEHALSRTQVGALGQTYMRITNFLAGMGEGLRGRGFTTAEDVYRSLMMGDKAPPAARDRLRAAVEGTGAGAAQAGAAAPDSVEAATADAKAGAQGSYFARRETDPNQMGLFHPRSAAAQRGPIAVPKLGNMVKNFEYFARNHSNPHFAVADWVRAEGDRTGVEHLGVFDAANQVPLSVSTDGKHGTVSFPPGLVDAWRSPGTRSISHHNHPSSTSFSKADYIALAEPGHTAMVAHGADGTIYVASIGPALRDRNMSIGELQLRFAAEQAAAQNRLYPFMRDQILTRGMPVKAAERAFSDFVARAMHENGLIDYRTTFEIQPATAHIADRAIRIAGGFDDGRPTYDAAGVHRPPIAILPGEGMGKLFGDIERAAAGPPASAGRATAGSGGGANAPGFEPGVKPAQGRLFSRRNPQLDTPEFKRWFGASKVVDGAGNPLRAYHGTQRPDRVGNRFRKDRATAGPMAFFTDSPDLASNYARAKSDTSITDADYGTQFKFKPKSSRSELPLDRAWAWLPQEERQRIAALAHRVMQDDDGNVTLGGADHRGGPGGYDWALKEARGNHLKALKDQWLDGGILFGREEEFIDVLRKAGVETPVRNDDPSASYSAVIPVYLAIQKPLDTHAVPPEVVAALEKAARRQRTPQFDRQFGTWNKLDVRPAQWIADLKADVENAKAGYTWTVIPDWATKTLQALGYDGIRDRSGKGGGEEHTVWIPFDEHQVKSATGNRGTFDPAQKRIDYSRRDDEATGLPHLYSAVARAAADLKQPRGTGEQMAAMLARAPGVKPEEMKWLGVDDWLRGQKSVTREEVQDYIRANALRLEEVRQGLPDRRDLDAAHEDMERQAGALVSALPEEIKIERTGQVWPANNVPAAMVAEGRPPYVRVEDLPESVRPQARAWLASEAELRRLEDADRDFGMAGPQYADYALPGGENYREVLLALPPKALTGQAGPAGWADASNSRSRTNDPNYYSNHWNTPNVLAHVRFDERQAPDGKKVLMVHEVQSDWHQAGRRKGYKEKGRSKPENPRNFEQFLQAQGKEFNEAYREQFQRRSGPEYNAWDNEVMQRSGANYDYLAAVPDAPFKTSWPMLAMKRMIAEAVDTGADRVAWSPGEVHADRYDLSKKIKDLHYIKNEDGTYILAPEDHQGREIPVNDGKPIPSEKLSDYVGKEVAEKIINGEGGGTDLGVMTLSGVDLKVGGEGMRGFYDTILPREVQKLVGKFGAKVGRSEVETGKYQMTHLPGEDPPYMVQSIENPGDRSFHRTAEEALAKVNENGAVPVHSFDITPELRAAVEGGGLPLFSRRDQTESPEFRRWFGKSRVVDSTGKPKTMYHGSNSPDIEAFDPSKANPSALYGPGLYFTDAPHVAGSDGGARSVEELAAKAAFGQAGYAFQGARYDLPPLTPRQIGHAKRLLWGNEVARDAYEDIGARQTAKAGQVAFLAGEPALREWLANDAWRWMRDRMKLERQPTTAPTVYPVHLKIERPFEVDGTTPPTEALAMYQRAVDQFRGEPNVFPGAGKSNITQFINSQRDPERAVPNSSIYDAMRAEIGPALATEALKRMGFDGIHHEGGRGVGTMGPHDVWIAFEPQQVKSAIGNRGTFDPNSPLMTFSRREEPAPPGEIKAENAKLGPPLTGIRGTMTRIGQAVSQRASEYADAFRHTVVPITTGTDEARGYASKFANTQALIAYRYNRITEALTKKYDTPTLRRMFEALDDQSLFEQELRDQLRGAPDATAEAAAREAFRGRGLDSLTEEQRRAVVDLDALSKQTWERMKERGLVQAKGGGLPFWAPRFFVRETAGILGMKAERILPDRPIGITDPLGLNLSTQGPSRREIRITEESLRTMREKYGGDVNLVRDIRTLPRALAAQERSIAGVDLVKAIREYGERNGLAIITDHVAPEKRGEYVTLDHPAMTDYRLATKEDPATGERTVLRDKDGNTIPVRVPLMIHKDFAGPMKAVLTKPMSELYRGALALKSGVVGIIMLSPFMHGAVVYSKALPLLPGKVATFQAYFDGNRVRRSDPARMEFLIKNGLRPIGGSWMADALGIQTAQGAGGQFGMTARAVGAAVRGLMGDNAGLKAAGGVDKAIHFWHGTLLWDRVYDLQVGIADTLQRRIEAKGFSPEAAAAMASHEANRAVGALPREALSNFANKVANLSLFSRSFTLGNLGIYKDAVNGMPAYVRALVNEGHTPAQAKAAMSELRNRTIKAIVFDLGLFIAGTALMQSLINVGANRKSGQEEIDGYWERLKHEAKNVTDNPSELLNPIAMLERVSPTHDNERGKQNRIFLGIQDDGRGLYVRNPVGKFGEDLIGWMPVVGDPWRTLQNKLAPNVRPIIEAVFNQHADRGGQVYDRDAETAAQKLRALGDIAKHVLFGGVSNPTIELAIKSAQGKATDIAVLKGLGSLAGFTFAEGSARGPAGGELATEARQHKFYVDQAYPKAYENFRLGKTDAAMQVLLDAGASQIEAVRMMRSMGRNAPTAAQTRSFIQRAGPEGIDRLDRLRAGP